MQIRKNLVHFVMTLALGMCRQAHAAWQPPIGIPEPPFGLNEAAPPSPNPWTAPVPGYYYVSESAATGTDTNNPYGTPTKPRKSIPYTLPAGSVVEVHGLYTPLQRGGRAITCKGTQAMPVFIRGTGDAVLTNEWQVQGSYCILENLTFALNPSLSDKSQFMFTPGIAADSHYMVFRHNKLYGHLNGGGLAIKTPSDAGTHVIDNVLIWDNHIHHNGNVNATFDQDNHGIMVNGNTNNIWIVDNELDHNSGDGTQINAGIDGNARVHHIYFGRNNSHENKQYGVWVKQASDVVISQNELHHHSRSNSSTGGCTGTQYGPARLWYLFNHLHDCEVGFRASTDVVTTPTVVDHYYIGNLVHDIHILPGSTYRVNNNWDPAAFSIVGDGPITRHIINNTVYNIDAGINVAQQAEKIIMRNNIFGGLAPNRGVYINLSKGVAATSTFDSTLFDPAAQIIWGGGKAINLTSFRAAYPQLGANSLEANAAFVDPSTGDYRERPTSPTVDAGADDGVYQTFYSLYGIDIAKDMNGIQRPQNRWDLGACELGPDSPPSPPLTLQVN